MAHNGLVMLRTRHGNPPAAKLAAVIVEEGYQAAQGA